MNYAITIFLNCFLQHMYILSSPFLRLFQKTYNKAEVILGSTPVFIVFIIVSAHATAAHV